MNNAEYHRMRDLEDHYWWFVARRRLALRLLNTPSVGHDKVLDLGCGTGAVASELAKTWHVTGVDYSDVALDYCHSRGLRDLCRSDASRLALRGQSFDAIVGLDMFEHIEDDCAALAESFRVLKPGGKLVLSVPAYTFLWGPHDVALMHFRRYTRKEVSDRLRTAGFEIEKISYSVFLLFPIVCVVRFFERRKKGEPKASLAPLPDWVNRLLIGVQNLEHWLIERVNLPWGSSVVAVAVRP